MAKRAICIGINDYPGTGMDLQGAVNDAVSWAKMLRARNVEVLTELHNQMATKEAIVTAMVDLLQRSGPKDLAIITYAGHGTWVPDLDGDEADGRDEGWVTYDLENGPLIDDDINAIFRNHKKPGTKIVIISDSCHSGTVARGFALKAVEARKRFLPPTLLPHLKQGNKSVPRRIMQKIRSADTKNSTGLEVPDILLLAACSDKEYAFDTTFDNVARGAFSFLLQEILSGKLPSTATYRDVFQAVCRRLPSEDHPQTPQISGSRTAQRWRIFADG